jgi:hypothetical protein
MSVEQSAAKREFFLNGAKLYLEVRGALEEFRRQVRGKCTSVVQSRLRDIGGACEMDWNLQALTDYKWGPEGTQELGRKLAIEGLGKNYGGLYFCLELDREDGGCACGAVVYLYRQNARLASDLWARLKESDSPVTGGYREGPSLIFWRPILEDEIPEFEEHLNVAIDDFIAFISRWGGLKKHI